VIRFKKKKVSTVFIAVAIIILFSLCSNVATSNITSTVVVQYAGVIVDAYSGLSFLHTDGSLIENQQGQVVMLRGCSKMSMEYTDYNDLGAYNIQYSDFQNIKTELDANVVRINLALSLLFPTFNVSEPDPTYLSYMDNIVSWCQSLNMYVLFDLHCYYPMNSTYPGGAPSDFWNATVGSGISQPYANVITQFWVFIAERYQSNPTVFGFDLYNEPWNAVPSVDRPTFSEWVTQIEGWIDAITAVNPNLLFIVENAGQQDWGQNDWRWVLADPIDRSNVVYSPHFYPELEDGSWNDYLGIPLLGSNFTSDYSAQNFAAAKSELTSFVNADFPQNVPILIGEFGSSNDSAGLQYLSDFLGICQNNGWSWTAWTWCGRPQPSYSLVEEDWVTLSSQGTVVKGHT
jgi:aryl-phospho-beta-D-glucosidase BglC (GH1 family)